ncbi:hypothetical protein ASC80_03210 [Afipia sp. Root123D2]|uniref:hypothetical protein n=1 Tax=Afipia sp. Root123D2 TaxID=1736436 RepID=UPI0006F7C374|nr:hypothetical protein [Afipia sp. Root123D2]KQW22413.1 hypothetical protein ASC80_03210 [Afipia sp. Root123D2]
MIHPSMFLRRALLADAIFSGVSALLLTFGAGYLATLLNLPETLLRETGLFLIAYAAFVGILGSRAAMPKALVLLVIAGNAAWTLASVALLLSGIVSPNLLGEAAVVMQAIMVGVFAELQFIGLRRGAAAVA